MAWLDCPLSGGAPGALAGRLTVMAGGAERDFEKAGVVMKKLASNYTLMGGVGAGQTTKLVNQVLCAIQFQAVAEAVALAERGGVAAERIPAALAGGRADSRILQEFGGKMARRDYSPTGRLDNMVKDLDGVQALARATRTPLPVTAIVAEIHRAFVAGGQGGEDNAALMRQFDGPRLGPTT
jgi:2-hydroxy-3-oxopropionate reductase